MLDLGLLGLTNPWLLTAVIGLPVLWWLLRVIPPAPQRLRFPAIRFLLGLQPEEQTSARTPPWLLVLRLLLATLLILALAGPVFNPEPELSGEGPLVLVVDDGWAAAPAWDERLRALERFTARAQRDSREVILIGTAPDPSAPNLRRLSATDAVRSASSWEPKPWPVDRMAALEELRAEPLHGAEIVWLSDGLAGSPAAREAASGFAQGLSELGPVQVFAEPAERRAPLLLPQGVDGERLTGAPRRGGAGELQQLAVKALGPTGEVLAREPLTFAEDATRAEAQFELPIDLSNRIARFELEPRQAVGGVVLLDERWRRRVVGLVGETAAQSPQPLLSELYYIERALQPRAEMRRGSVAELIAGEVSAIVLPDGAQVSSSARAQLRDWVEKGGVLLRFAGPRLANAEDDLVPVDLRRGDRNLDGAMSWARPQPLTAFDEEGPLAGLEVPEGDVVVHRQVLAQPGPELASRAWARLADGTPLITGAPDGKGWLVLVHTTANTTWSSLPLSGAFMDLLQRMVALAPGAGGGAQGQLAPIEVLDADGDPAGACRYANRPAAARPAVQAPRSDRRRRGRGGAAAGVGHGSAGPRAGRIDRRSHRRDPVGIRPDRPERGRRAQSGWPGRAQPRAQPAHRGGCRRATRRQSRDRRPQSVSAAVLADPERAPRPRVRRGRTARRLSAPGGHDPVRHRRRRHHDSRSDRGRTGRAAPGPAARRAQSAAPRAGGGGSHPDALLLSAPGFPRPVHWRRGMGRPRRAEHQ